MPPSALHKSLCHLCHLLPLLCGLIVSEDLSFVSENALSGKFSQVKCKNGMPLFPKLMQLLARKTANNCINQPFCAIVALEKPRKLHFTFYSMFSNCFWWKKKRKPFLTKKDASTRHPLLVHSILSEDYFQYSSCDRYPSYCVRLSSSVRFSGLGMWLIRKSIRASFESYKYLPSL